MYRLLSGTSPRDTYPLTLSMSVCVCAHATPPPVSPSLSPPHLPPHPPSLFPPPLTLSLGKRRPQEEEAAESISQHTATHCNSLPHTATHCHTLPHTATHCHTLPHAAAHCTTLQAAASRRDVRVELYMHLSSGAAADSRQALAAPLPAPPV